jgi:hypothetical protein
MTLMNSIRIFDDFHCNRYYVDRMMQLMVGRGDLRAGIVELRGRRGLSSTRCGSTGNALIIPSRRRSSIIASHRDHPWFVQNIHDEGVDSLSSPSRQVRRNPAKRERDMNLRYHSESSSRQVRRNSAKKGNNTVHPNHSGSPVSRNSQKKLFLGMNDRF